MPATALLCRLPLGGAAIESWFALVWRAVLSADRIRAFTETLTSAVGTAGILSSTEAARYW